MATMTAAALTSGGACGGRGVGEGESSKGGTVLHLQALGCGVGRGAVDKPMEEGAGEGKGGDHHCRCRFDGRGCRLQSPVKPYIVDNDNDNNNDKDDNNKGMVLRGGET